MDLLAVGGVGVSAFVGLNAGKAEALGLNLTDTGFALVLAADQQNAQRHWMSLKAESGAVAFVGMEGLTVGADTVRVEINKGYTETDGSLSVIDYQSQALEVQTGTGTTLTMDMNGTQGELLEGLGKLHLNVFSFSVSKARLLSQRQRRP